MPSAHSSIVVSSKKRRPTQEKVKSSTKSINRRNANPKPIQRQLDPSSTKQPGHGKKRRYRPGTAAKRDAIKQMRSSKGLFQQATFDRKVHEFAADSQVKFRRLAREAMREACEAYAAGLFADALKCTYHRGAETLTGSDIDLAMKIRGENFVY